MKEQSHRNANFDFLNIARFFQESLAYSSISMTNMTAIFIFNAAYFTKLVSIKKILHFICKIKSNLAQK